MSDSTENETFVSVQIRWQVDDLADGSRIPDIRSRLAKSAESLQGTSAVDPKSYLYVFPDPLKAIAFGRDAVPLALERAIWESGVLAGSIVHILPLDAAERALQQLEEEKIDPGVSKLLVHRDLYEFEASLRGKVARTEFGSIIARSLVPQPLDPFGSSEPKHPVEDEHLSRIVATVFASTSVDPADLARLVLGVSRAYEAVGGPPLEIHDGGTGRLLHTKVPA